MTLMKKLLPAAMLLGGIAIAATPALAYPARSESAVNVRSGPGTQFDVVDQLSPGEPVNVQGCNGGWCHISGSGWVSGNYLTASGDGGGSYDDAYDDGPYYGGDYYAGPDLFLGFGGGYGGGWHGGHNWHGGHGHRLLFGHHH